MSPAVSSPADLGLLLDRLHASVSAWRAVPPAARAQVIADAAAAWRDPAHPDRCSALARFAQQSGWAPGLTAASLDFFLEKCTVPALLAESACVGLETRAPGAPRVTLHWLAGNTPWAGLESLVAAALAGSASLVKTARREPVFAEAFADALSKAHPALAGALAVTYWEGADRSLDVALWPRLDLVVAFGADDTMAELAGRVRPTAGAAPRFVAHGHRLSAAILGESAWGGERAMETAERVALDHVADEQQGCLSPRGVYLVGPASPGAEERAAAFGQLVADRLAAWQARWPRAAIDAGAASSVQQIRESLRLPGRSVWASPDATLWSVVLDADTPFEPAPAARFVWLRRAPTLAAAIASLGPARRLLSTVAWDGFSLSQEETEKALAPLSPDRVCLPGTMQRPPLGWSHDGASDLAWLVGNSSSREER